MRRRRKRKGKGKEERKWNKKRERKERKSKSQERKERERKEKKDERKERNEKKTMNRTAGKGSAIASLCRFQIHHGGTLIHTNFCFSEAAIMRALPLGSVQRNCPGTILRHPDFPNVSWWI